MQYQRSPDKKDENIIPEHLLKNTNEQNDQKFNK